MGSIESLPAWYPVRADTRADRESPETKLFRECSRYLEEKLRESEGRAEALRKQLINQDAVAELLKSHLNQVTSEVKLILTKALNPEPQLPPVLRSEFERIIRDGLVNNIPLVTIEKQLHWEARGYEDFLERESRRQIEHAIRDVVRDYENHFERG